jgi:predicted component of type VI protein secretion system
MGRLTRVALQGLLQAVQAAREPPAGRRGRPHDAGSRAVNPLRMDTPLESKLRYLFGGQAAAAGCMPPDRAVAELVDQLMAHEQAMGEALQKRSAGLLDEFSPDALKARLLAGGSKLFESARRLGRLCEGLRGARRDARGWIRVLLDRPLRPGLSPGPAACETPHRLVPPRG